MEVHPLAGTASQPQEGAGHLFQVAREVLGAHAHIGGTHGVGTGGGHQGRADRANQLRVVHHRREPSLVVNGGGRPGRRDEGVHEPLEHRRNLLPQSAVRRSQRALHLHLRRDDVVSPAAADRPEYERHGSPCVDETIHERRKLAHHQPGRMDEVHGGVGPCGVAARPLQGDREPIGTGGDGTVLQSDTARLEAGVDVECDDRADSLEHALPHELVCTAREGLLGRLEDDPDPAGKVEPGQHQRHPEPDRRVGVVSARVHHSRGLRGEREAAWLVDGQRVEIRPERDHRTVGAEVEQQSGLGGPHTRLETAGSQDLGETFRRAVLLTGEFGVPVDGTTRLDDEREHVCHQPGNSGGIEHGCRRVAGTRTGDRTATVSFRPMKVAGAQIDLVVGDLRGNEERIADAMRWAEDAGADVLLLPELAVTGYPPEDLVYRERFVGDNLEVVRRLAERSGRTATVVGFVDRAAARDSGDARRRPTANAAALLRDGAVQGVYHKVLLPNYGVFDEDRHFAEGTDPAAVWSLGETTVGVSICEDIWVADGPPIAQAGAGAEILLNINASPFHRGKAREREEMLKDRAREAGVPVVYLNTVGGQDELVFDGASLVLARDGSVLHRSPQFAEDRFLVDVPVDGTPTAPCCVADLLDVDEEIYRALVTGLRDYVWKNGFEDVVIGLSGGIDSALTAALAADALGPDHVWGVSMPARFSSGGSVDDSRELAENLGIRFDVIPIDDVFQAHLEGLAPAFGDTPFGLAEENLQARIRGATLMALSNKFGPMVVATGNKSEMAAGYSTLYGDMVGGFAVIKDVLKTVVYDLARWRNRGAEVIPQAIIDKEPSAELRPDQRDSDSLPPYEVLDGILLRYIERDLDPPQIVSEGFDPGLVRDVVRMVDRNEYKRRQAAPGVKVTTKAFGRDRRLPITNWYGREQ